MTVQRSQPISTEEELALLHARGDLAVQNRNYWQAEAESLRTQLAEFSAQLTAAKQTNGGLRKQLASARKALEAIEQRANESGTGEMALIDTICAMNRIATSALKDIPK